MSPKPSHLPLIVRAAATWLKTYPDGVLLWIDNDTGRRICCLIDDIRLKDPGVFRGQENLRNDLDQLLAALIRIGVANAARLEQALPLSQAIEYERVFRRTVLYRTFLSVASWRGERVKMQGFQEVVKSSPSALELRFALRTRACSAAATVDLRWRFYPALLRNRRFADSPLEGNGFEPSVPGR